MWLYIHVLTLTVEVKAWMINNIHLFCEDVIAYACHNPDSGLSTLR